MKREFGLVLWGPTFFGQEDPGPHPELLKYRFLENKDRYP